MHELRLVCVRAQICPHLAVFDSPRHRLNIARGDDLLNVFRQGFPHPRAHIRSFFGCLAQFSAALIFFPTTPRTLLGLKVYSNLSAETLYLAKE